jgi:CheY-like chemotaxis protein
MSQETKKDFIVIDDDPINNMICSKIIQLTLPGSDIRTFTSPEKGVEHLQKHAQLGSENLTLLFLDINMPSINGWDVLERLDKFPPAVKEKMKIYILSSSVDFQDKEKADSHYLVSGYITKPLSQLKLLEIFPSK